MSQSGLVADGPLGSILTVGNLKRIKLNSDNQTGQWKISIDSTSYYTLRVIGNFFSAINNSRKSYIKCSMEHGLCSIKILVMISSNMHKELEYDIN